MKIYHLIILCLPLYGCKDIHTSFSSEDVISTETFISKFKECAVYNKQQDRMTGVTFRDCTVVSYNLAMER
jgi:hypothetical protein